MGGGGVDRHSQFLPPLSKQEIIQLRSQLAELNDAALRDFYTRAYTECSLHGRIPTPRFIQTLVTAWKVLYRRSNPKKNNRRTTT